ncbi:MAG: potassium channel family protein [Marinibacterium sp.]|nr:potassium channel family protein [Marinibacterium sp.]
MKPIGALRLALALLVVVAAGTVFFHLVEGWRWLDAYFFTMVTISTVGYGSLVPQTDLGKIGATVFILIGIGVFALAIQRFSAFTLLHREQRLEKLLRDLSADMEDETREEWEKLTGAGRSSSRKTDKS